MTPAQVAVNAKAVANLAARLERMGWPTDNCHATAEHIALELLADGYRPLDKPPPPRGPSSTPEGRARARAIYQHTRTTRERTT